MDFSKLTDDDLLALKGGDYSKLSDEALLALKSSSPAATVQQNPQPDYQGAYGPAAGLAQGASQIAQMPGHFLSMIPGMGQAMQQVTNSPIGLGQNFMNMVNRGAGALGQKAAEVGAQNGMDPRVAAGIGTLTTVAPDLVMAASQPSEVKGPATPEAVGLMRRALGFSKRFMNTPFARGQAALAAKTALEEGVMPLSGNPDAAFKNAMGLANKAGTPIGQTLENVPVGDHELLQSSFDLKGALQKITGGLTTGTYEKAVEEFNGIQDNLEELYSKGADLTAQNLNKIKVRIANSINYFADLAAQSDKKAAVNSLANSVRNMVKGFVDPEEFTQFLANQKLYSGAKLMLKGLNNEIAAQTGNRMVGPYATIAATGEMIKGNPIGAANALGWTEMGLRRGAGASARAIQDIGVNLPSAANLTNLRMLANQQDQNQ